MGAFIMRHRLPPLLTIGHHFSFIDIQAGVMGGLSTIPYHHTQPRSHHTHTRHLMSPVTPPYHVTTLHLPIISPLNNVITRPPYNVTTHTPPRHLTIPSTATPSGQRWPHSHEATTSLPVKGPLIAMPRWKRE